MRVSSFAFSRFSITEMNRQTENLNKFQEQISTGKKLLKPSDDPAQMAATESLDASLMRMDQYEKSTAQMTRQLAQEETVLDNITDSIQRLTEITIAANSGIVNDQGRQAYLAEVEEIRNQLVDNANTRTPDGEYLFAGGNSREKPFIDSGEYVNYYGDQTQNYVKISDSRKVKGADTGAELFQNIRSPSGISSSSIFVTVELLEDTLQLSPSNSSTTDQYHDQLDISLSYLQAASDHINTKRSDVGARMRYIETTEYENESIGLVLEETRSTLEDADLSEAISNLQFQETTLQALRATYAKVSSNSLFNYL